jgi:hypothetical protein
MKMKYQNLQGRSRVGFLFGAIPDILPLYPVNGLVFLSGAA